MAGSGDRSPCLYPTLTCAGCCQRKAGDVDTANAIRPKSARSVMLEPHITKLSSDHVKPDQMNVVRSAAAAVMSAAGAVKTATAPAREAACEVASETSAGHAVGGLLMLQPNAATPPTHHPMHQQPMHPPMHQPVPVPVPHAPLPHQLPQAAAAYPAQMQAMVPMQAGLGHGLPPMAVTPPPMTTIATITPLPPPYMQMVSHPC
eukprot:scaffold76616_cov21-Phaeocystis_antarctica.AAC.1